MYKCDLCGREFLTWTSRRSHRVHCIPKHEGRYKKPFGGKGRLPFPIEDILVENSTYSKTHNIRLRLISEGYKKHQCEICNRKSWQGKPIPLELHHINGITNDHRIENLQIICPNCHAQTDNFKIKNMKRS